jgi:hypothetical protein
MNSHKSFITHIPTNDQKREKKGFKKKMIPLKKQNTKGEVTVIIPTSTFGKMSSNTSVLTYILFPFKGLLCKSLMHPCPEKLSKIKHILFPREIRKNSVLKRE